jgi:hypothetical protein
VTRAWDPAADLAYDRRGTRDAPDPAEVASIADLTSAAREIIEGAFPMMWVRGEVTDFKQHRSGHWYFALRDSTAQVRAVVWSRDRFRIPAAPDEGMQVLAYGRLTVYSARGEMQFAVSRIEAEGDGLWRKKLEASKKKLEADGLLAPERTLHELDELLVGEANHVRSVAARVSDEAVDRTGDVVRELSQAGLFSWTT